MTRKPAAPGQKPRQNQNGQSMGAKGQQTRQRLLEATAELIQSKPLRELTVSDITRRAKTASSTFYLYFQDATEAVLAVARMVSQSTPELLEMLDAPWPPETANAQAQAFVASYTDHWQRNRAIYRVRNLAADEGDERFSTVRRLSIAPLLQALARRIHANQQAGNIPADLHPFSTAGALISLLERIASVTFDAVNEYEVSPAKIDHAIAFFVLSVLETGATPEKTKPVASAETA